MKRQAKQAAEKRIYSKKIAIVLLTLLPEEPVFPGTGTTVDPCFKPVGVGKCQFIEVFRSDILAGKINSGNMQGAYRFIFISRFQAYIPAAIILGAVPVPGKAAVLREGENTFREGQVPSAPETMTVYINNAPGTDDPAFI